MKKRLLSLALGTMMVLSTLAGCGSKDGGSAAVNTKPEEQGKVLNIYCWNEEFKSRFEGYYKNVPSDVKVNWVITPNENNAYQNALDAALLKQKDAAALVDDVLNVIAEALQSGDSVTIPGFGTFEVRERAARSGYNPKTQKKIEVPATKVPAFRAGKQLKLSVNH